MPNEKKKRRYMIKITNEINGKLYELVPENEMNPCEGCAFDKNSDIVCSLKDDCFNGCCVCGELHGIWKEVKDNEKTN
jgi:hypothetical protein